MSKQPTASGFLECNWALSHFAQSRLLATIDVTQILGDKSGRGLLQVCGDRKPDSSLLTGHDSLCYKNMFVVTVPPANVLQEQSVL